MRSKLLVGSGKDLSRRLSEYYSPAKLNYKNKNNQLRPIHAAILKYGHEQFNVIILEVLGKKELINSQQIMEREQFYLNLSSCGRQYFTSSLLY
jgi:group I intron endonuclease